jgi:WD40 repeat protein
LDDDFRFAFSSDETWIATESASTLRLKPVKGNANVELPLPSGAIWAVNGGSRPLVAVADSTGISVVDAQSRSIVQHLPARDRWFTSLAWSKDIPLLAIGDWDGKVTLWNVGWGASWRFGNINNMIDTVWVGSAHHLPDCNRSLVFAENLAGDDSVKISGCNVFRRISVQSSNRREASVGFGDIGGEVHLNWSGHKCQVLVSVNDETSWGCDSSGRLLMARGRLSSNEGDINGGQPHNIFATYAGLDREARGARGVAVNGGKHIAIFVSDQLAIWKLESASARRVVEVCHPTSATFADVASGSNPRFAVVLADEGSALLADLDTGATRLLKQLNEKAVTACFRPDSTECYFGTSGGRLLRLDTATDDPPELLDANFGLPAHMIATPDGERLFTAGPGEQLGIRRLSDGAPIVQLTHHGLALQSGRHNLKRLLYLPKQQRVISLSEDGWLSQW